MRKIIGRRKRSEFESMLLAVIFIFIVGVILLFMNHVDHKLYQSFDKYLNNSPTYNQSEAHRVSSRMVDIEETRIWDYASLFILMGIILGMLIFSFATRISPVFYWIFGILAVVIVLVGIILSNIWQTMANNPEFAESIQRFPITNAILGNYFPSIIIGIIFLGMIVLFGKPSTGGSVG